MYNFRGGVHPPQEKNTIDCPTLVMGVPERVIIPMVQHIGSPCEPMVKKGDTVKVGQLIGQDNASASAPIHSSVSGTVTSVEDRMLTGDKPVTCITIETDKKQEIWPDIKPPVVDSRESFIKAIRESGLTGLGGAGFPTHAKLNTPKGTKINTLIINAAECEPYITSDYRESIEHTKNIIDGIQSVLKWLDIPEAIIGIEDNKPEAIKKFNDTAKFFPEIKVRSLKTRYPQGAEKMLILSLTGRQVPPGKLPKDVGCIVMNVTSISFVASYLKTGMPLIKKRVTVDGSIVANPSNVEVLIGTPVSDVFGFCGGFTEDPAKIIMGGPMMGLALDSLDMPVLKHTNALLAFSRKEARLPEELACIRCGRCVKACPVNLLPLDIDRLVRKNQMDDVEKYNIMDCIECGSCSYVCPSKRILTQTIRLGKDKFCRMQKSKT